MIPSGFCCYHSGSLLLFLLIPLLIRLLESSSLKTFTLAVVTFGQEVNLFQCNPFQNSHTFGMLFYSSLFHPCQANFTSEGRLREGPVSRARSSDKKWGVMMTNPPFRFCFLFFELRRPKSISPSPSETMLVGQVNQRFISGNIERRHRLRDIIYSWKWT